MGERPLAIAPGITKQGAGGETGLQMSFINHQQGIIRSSFENFQE